VDGKEGGGSDLERAMARKEWKAAVVVWSDLVDGKEGKEGGSSDLEQSRGWQGRQGRRR
jgi:hypothetical protein